MLSNYSHPFPPIKLEDTEPQRRTGKGGEGRKKKRPESLTNQRKIGNAEKRLKFFGNVVAVRVLLKTLQNEKTKSEDEKKRKKNVINKERKKHNLF